jgi:hypothetical protein
MDYTNNPEGSMHPDVTNFEFLAAVYGTNIAGTVSAGSSNTSSVGGVNRRLRHQRSTIMMHEAGKLDDNDSSRIPAWVSERIKSVHQQLTRMRRRIQLQPQQQRQQHQQQQFLDQSSRNRLLQGGGTHRIDLGQGYSMVVHMLHADASVVT